jgi:glucosamine--fructose-6-phosphate aminotransferase (isomerizing)
MSESAQATLREILSQTQAWEQALQVVNEHRAELRDLDLGRYEQIIFIGCGSTHYLSVSAAAVMQSLSGLICRGLPSSEIILAPESIFTNNRGKTLLVAVSRSGTTTETLRGVQTFREGAYGDVITITNYGSSELASMGDINLVIENGQEKSVAQTKSFASMFVAANAVASLMSNREELLEDMKSLGAVGEQVLHKHHQEIKTIGEDRRIAQFFFLGSGLNYGLACELSLKMKEMSLSVSEPFHFLEFRHGPKSMITPSTLVIGLYSDRNYLHERAVIDEVASLQGSALSLGEAGASINFNSGLPEVIRGVLFLPLLQLMAYHRSIHMGLDPDHPRNLSAVIELDLP